MIRVELTAVRPAPRRGKKPRARHFGLHSKLKLRCDPVGGTTCWRGCAPASYWRDQRKRPVLQAEDVEHGRVALLLEFRREDKFALGRRTRSRCDGDVLLAVDF